MARIAVTRSLELLDDRAPGSTTDTTERFDYDFADNFSGWKTFNVPWSLFVRKATQPAGAPNNGLTLTQMWGYSFALLSGKGSFELDEIQLLTTSTPIATPQPAATSTPTMAPTATSTALSLLIEDFESGAVGWSVFNDAGSTINWMLVSPGQAGVYALQLTASIGANGWAGVQRSYASAQDWTAYSNIDF
jgi:hypothetical protein